MPINFNKNSIFHLKPIERSAIRKDVEKLLLQNEEIMYAFKTIRDQLIFTNKRIISVDIQNITGKRKEFTVLPYSKIQYFSVQTPGLLEILPDNELYIRFSDGFEATFEFNGYVDIVEIAKMLSKYIL